MGKSASRSRAPRDDFSEPDKLSPPGTTKKPQEKPPKPSNDEPREKRPVKWYKERLDIFKQLVNGDPSSEKADRPKTTLWLKIKQKFDMLSDLYWDIAEAFTRVWLVLVCFVWWCFKPHHLHYVVVFYVVNGLYQFFIFPRLLRPLNRKRRECETMQKKFNDYNDAMKQRRLHTSKNDSKDTKTHLQKVIASREYFFVYGELAKPRVISDLLGIGQKGISDRLKDGMVFNYLITRWSDPKRLERNGMPVSASIIRYSPSKPDDRDYAVHGKVIRITPEAGDKLVNYFRKRIGESAKWAEVNVPVDLKYALGKETYVWARTVSWISADKGLDFNYYITDQMCQDALFRF